MFNILKKNVKIQKETINNRSVVKGQLVLEKHTIDLFIFIFLLTMYPTRGLRDLLSGKWQVLSGCIHVFLQWWQSEQCDK